MRGTVSTLCAKTSGRASNTSPRSGLAVEVGREQLDAGARVDGVDLPDRLGVQPRAAVGQVVAGDARDGRVALHPLHAVGDAARLVRVVGGRLAGVDLAEVAAARALRAADEERRLAVLPALVDVGAAGLLAHGVQPSPFTSDCRAWYSGPIFAFVLIHSGLRSIGVCALRTSSRRAVRPPPARRRRRCSRSRPIRTRSCGDLVDAAKDAWKAAVTASTTRAGGTSRPSTSLIVVTPASEMPHGMICENGSSELSQLSAKPCIVTPRWTRTPIAAILSSESGRRTQTPLRPSTR
jgi:hypothetical protein